MTLSRRSAQGCTSGSSGFLNDHILRATQHDGTLNLYHHLICFVVHWTNILVYHDRYPQTISITYHGLGYQDVAVIESVGHVRQELAYNKYLLVGITLVQL